MENESMMEWEDPVSYWRQRSRRALESQGVVLPPPRRPELPPYRRTPYGYDPLRYVPRRTPYGYGDPLRYVPRGVDFIRIRSERIGLDVICKDCGHHMSKSTRSAIEWHFYAPDGPPGSPLTRCSFKCRNCSYRIVLGRNIGDTDRFVVIAGATQHFPASDTVSDSNQSLQNEAYPDALVDSPNDFRPGRHISRGGMPST